MMTIPEQLQALPNGTFSERHSQKDIAAYSLVEEAFLTSKISLIDKLESFPRFSTKRSIARFIVKNEIYKKIIGVAGIVVECGVFNGAGLFTWAQLQNIYEPSNYTRKIVGFDTFSGFPEVNDQEDNSGVLSSKPGDLRGSSIGELSLSVEKYNAERQLSHIQNMELVKGDFMNTSEEFLERNSHTIISLLYLDFDLFEPTKKALEIFLPRMPKGSIVAFDEINCDSFPGETKALNQVMGISNYQINRFPFDPWISYIVL